MDPKAISKTRISAAIGLECGVWLNVLPSPQLGTLLCPLHIMHIIYTRDCCANMINDSLSCTKATC